jgi:carbon-monoxide dehydrogenase large subunit
MPFSSVVPMRNAARILPGPYQVKQIHVQGEARPSPQAAVNIYRGAGRPEATLLMETLVEAAARALKIDPIAVRRTNLLNPDRFPAATPTGETLDSGDYPRLLDLACARFDYERERREQQSRRERGERVGIGAAFYVEPCGQGWEWARVTAHAGGTFTVASGSPAQGQGHLTTWAAIAAEALGCAPEAIEVVIGDTAQCPQGIGSLASRSTAIGGSAIVKACRELLEQRASGRPLPITVEHRFDSQEAWSAGCILARVAIDRDTGDLKVEKLSWADDAGRIIQPELAHGQLLGGAAQGLGQALMEQIHYDAEGQLLTGSLMDYAIPRAADMPPIDIASIATPSPNNPLGAKGVGEAGCIGVPAAVMNAVRDALSDLGEVQLGFPLNAEQIWRLIHCPQSELSK